MAWWDQQSPLLSTVAAPFKALGVPGGMLRNVMVGRNPLDALSDPDAAASGRDVLENYGMLDPNQEGLDAGDVAGFGAEMLLDPLNFVGGFGIGRKALANRAISKANAPSLALREAGAMPAEVAALTKIAKPDFKQLIPDDEIVRRYENIFGDIPRDFQTGQPDIQGMLQGMRRAASEAHSPNADLDEFLQLAKDAYTPGTAPLPAYHGTAAQPFEQFTPDPGTGNWMGRGAAYLTGEPDAAGNYTRFNKTPLFAEAGKRQAEQVRQAVDALPLPEPLKAPLLEKLRPATSDPFDIGGLNTTPHIGALTRELAPDVRSAVEKRVRDIQGSLEMPPDTFWPKIKADAEAQGQPVNILDQIDKWREQATTPADPFHAAWSKDIEHELNVMGWEAEQALQQLNRGTPHVMKRFVDSRKPFTFEEPATMQDLMAMARAAKEYDAGYSRSAPNWVDSFLAQLKNVKTGGEPLRKGDVWAALASNRGGRVSPDKITDVLEKQGYDLLQHGENFSPSRGLISPPPIDMHSEIVPFRTDQIYMPWIAPELQKPIPWRNDVAALAGYNASQTPRQARPAPWQ